MKLRTVIGACTLIAAIPFTTNAELTSDGSWEVKRGDTLYNIARRVAPGNGKEQARIRKHMFSENPSAFKNNNPGSLEVGKTLSLPGAAIVAKPAPKPKPKAKPVAKAAVIAPAVAAPVVSAPAPKPAVSTPKPKAGPTDSFKARIEAKRIAKEAADKRRAEAAQLEAQQQSAQQAVDQQAAQQAAQLAQQQKAMAAKQREAAAMAAKQREAAAMAAKQKAAADAAAAKKRAAVQKPKAAPQAARVNNTTNSSNPYVECKTTSPDEKCGNWNITYKGR